MVSVHVHARPALDVPGGLALGPVPGGRGACVLAERGGRACGLAARGTSLFNVHNAMLMAMAVSLRARTPASMPCGCCGTLLSGACTVASM